MRRVNYSSLSHKFWFAHLFYSLCTFSFGHPFSGQLLLVEDSAIRLLFLIRSSQIRKCGCTPYYPIKGHYIHILSQLRYTATKSKFNQIYNSVGHFSAHNKNLLLKSNYFLHACYRLSLKLGISHFIDTTGPLSAIHTPESSYQYIRVNPGLN